MGAASNLESDGSENTIVQGVCPDGWHLPNKVEWEELFAFVGTDSAATKLKSTNLLFWNETNPNLHGKDTYGFNAIASGGRDSAGAHYLFDASAYYWSSTFFMEDVHRVWTPYLSVSLPDVQIGSYSKTNSFCVRCVKD